MLFDIFSFQFLLIYNSIYVYIMAYGGGQLGGWRMAVSNPSGSS